MVRLLKWGGRMEMVARWVDSGAMVGLDGWPKGSLNGGCGLMVEWVGCNGETGFVPDEGCEDGPVGAMVIDEWCWKDVGEVQGSWWWRVRD
ncbi:hypothetical protein V6N11_074145 [Hibiscus sabdariffa]|uniref:Uncharacterized protein n=1 Tax=Hibiscus sabdariffa TaxID=183260 RepID=A0ABR2NWG6_9ROSI